MFKNSSLAAVAVVLLIAGSGVNAQTMFEDGVFKPFDEVSAPRDALAKSVEGRILYFVHFTCPFCRNAHGYMQEWGDQLPSPYRLEVVPAVALPDHYPMAIAYYAVVQLAPSRIREFERAMYGELQDRRGEKLSPDTFRRAAHSIGIDERAFNEAVQRPDTAGFVKRAYELTRRYAIDEVPTVLVANRYKTTPGRVQNDQRSFVAILNGLISMHYREREEL
jgi:protein-disulfide isomerase